MLATTVAMIEQFNKKNIELLNEMGYSVDVAGNFQQGNPISVERIRDFKFWVEERNGCCYDIPIVRNPSALKSNLAAYKKLISLLKENKYIFIHVHTPIGSVLGRMAAHKIGIPIIYTAHGFHFFKGAPVKNWLLFYPAEWLCSWWTDILITITHEDYEFAKRKMHAKQLEYIPGVGIDVDSIEKVLVNKLEKHQVLNIPEDAIVILSVGELNTNKNHAIVIQAMAKLKNNKVHYIICGQGAEQVFLEDLARNLGIQENVHILGFRNDVMELCKCSDIFAFPSKREGLSVALMEAMAASMPVICFRIRGNVDLIDEYEGGYLISPYDDVEFALKLEKLCLSKSLREKMGSYNRLKVNNYDIWINYIQMKEIYDGILKGKNI